MRMRDLIIGDGWLGVQALLEYSESAGHLYDLMLAEIGRLDKSRRTKVNQRWPNA